MKTGCNLVRAKAEHFEGFHVQLQILNNRNVRLIYPLLPSSQFLLKAELPAKMETFITYSGITYIVQKQSQ